MSDNNGWRPISEAPKDGSSIIAWDGADIEKIHFYKRDKAWVVDLSCDSEYGWTDVFPTHWMPLPEPPK
jgi:hypothetical protein